MKKILIACSLLLFGNISSSLAQDVDIWANVTCGETITVTLYGHDATHTGCGSLSSGPITVTAMNNPTYSNMIAIDDYSVCSLGSLTSPGWFYGVNPYCITSLRGAQWDGAMLSCTGCGGASPVYIGNSACLSTSAVNWYIDCNSFTETANWSFSGTTLDVAVHY